MALVCQAHRSDMIRKFMHLERNEYWEVQTIIASFASLCIKKPT